MSHPLENKLVKAIGNCGILKDRIVFGTLKVINNQLEVHNEKRIASVYSASIEVAPQLEYNRQPTKGEIKFGNGATHYKNFDALQYLKPNGEFKKWLVCSIDGLRYYRY